MPTRVVLTRHHVTVPWRYRADLHGQVLAVVDTPAAGNFGVALERAQVHLFARPAGHTR